MSEFNDLERRLRRYRPAGPPADLRARVVTPRARPRASRGSWWLVAAALTLALGLQTFTSHLYGGLATEIDARRQAERSSAIEDLTTQLGGDDAARREARRMIEMSERRKARVRLPPPDGGN